MNNRIGDQYHRHNFMSERHYSGGYVYIARSLDGYAKIGVTKNLRDRIKRLDRERRGKGFGWKCFRSAKVAENKGVYETELRRKLTDWRLDTVTQDYMGKVPEDVLSAIWDEVMS